MINRSTKFTRTVANFTFLSFFLIASNLFANNSPVGCWQTIDDETNKPKSIVKIEQTSSKKLSGTVAKILFTDDGSNPETRACDKCSGSKKNQRIKGMEILWGLKKDGNEWNNGTILDPKTGKEYNSYAYLSDNGSKLNVRGYIGFSLIGRTQTWNRLPMSECNNT